LPAVYHFSNITTEAFHFNGTVNIGSYADCRIASSLPALFERFTVASLPLQYDRDSPLSTSAAFANDHMPLDIFGSMLSLDLQRE
jgi:hypothetical protein